MLFRSSSRMFCSLIHLGLCTLFVVVYLYQLSHVRSVYKARQEVKLLFTLLFSYYHYLTGKLFTLVLHVELSLNIISYYHYLTDL